MVSEEERLGPTVRRVVFAIERQARGAKRGPRACPSEGVVRCIRHHSREPHRGMQSERAGWTGVVFCWEIADQSADIAGRRRRPLTTARG